MGCKLHCVLGPFLEGKETEFIAYAAVELVLVPTQNLQSLMIFWLYDCHREVTA